MAQKISLQKQKTRWALVSQRAEECVVSESLCTPQHARRMAVMMMAMRVSGGENHGGLKVNETGVTVNLGAILATLFLAVVHGHFQVHRDAELAVGQRFDANHFCHVVAIHGIVSGSVGKGDEHAHSLIVASAARMEINTFF
jgi:hypothetical protein